MNKEEKYKEDREYFPLWDDIHNDIFVLIFRCKPHSMSNTLDMRIRQAIVYETVREYLSRISTMRLVVTQQCISKIRSYLLMEKQFSHYRF